MDKDLGRTPWLGIVRVSSVRSIDSPITSRDFSVSPPQLFCHSIVACRSLTRCTLPGASNSTFLSVSLVVPSLLFHRRFPTAELQNFVKLAMDALVAQYSRPAFEDEGYSPEDQQELAQVTPPLSLKFALPPIAQVCLFTRSQALRA